MNFKCSSLWFKIKQLNRRDIITYKPFLFVTQLQVLKKDNRLKSKKFENCSI